MPIGGKRDGAGRKRGDLKYKDVVALLDRQITDELPGLVEVLVKLAKGVLVKKTGENGEAEVYLEKPDRDSAKYLIDRVAGKPEQRIRNRHSGVISLVSRSVQIDALADPEVLGLLCELDSRLASAPCPEGDDGGTVGEPGLGREMGLPAPPGTSEPSTNGNGCGPH